MFVPGFSLRNALTALLALSATGTVARPLSPGQEDGSDKEWITVWGAMPQLTEPNNLPPEPFVSAAAVTGDRGRYQNRRQRLTVTTPAP